MTTIPRADSAFDSRSLDAVRDLEALRRAYALPSDAARRKQTTEPTGQTRRLVGCASLVLIASADADGNRDVSPRGGPAGFVSVLDDRTVAIPDATGNKRLDTLENVIATGRAGLLFVIPGRTTTLRGERPPPRLHPPGPAVPADRRGQAARRRAGPGHRGGLPALPRSLPRSGAWQPGQWLPADAQPTPAEVTPAPLRMPGLTIADAERAEAESLKYRYGSGSSQRPSSSVAHATG